MGSYIPLTTKQQQEMLQSIGMGTTSELFVDVPPALKYNELKIPEGKSELEVNHIMQKFAAENKIFSIVFRGAGAYKHYIPSIVTQVASKETFVTAYTPYQAEISQGILQIIFEYQTEICELTGMDVSNASVYDGASAAAEATVMCRDRKRQRVLVAANIQPDTIAVVKTYCDSADVTMDIVAEEEGLINKQFLAELLGDDVACLYLQSPNFYGLVEDIEIVAKTCHNAGVKLIVGSNPMALALYKTPAELGADIVTGEGQPLGMPISFGGPYLGFMAAKTAMMRRLPGRIVGETTDSEGARAFVLTLQAREQHIRREKASSSICSNQALCALTATVYMATLGADGLKNVAVQCYSKAHYMQLELEKIGFGKKYAGDFFHEFVTNSAADVDKLMACLEAEGILGGLPLDGGILWCCTELNTKEDIDRVVEICKEVALCA